MESGTPMWLFRLPLVARARNFCESTERHMSLVLVLPEDPVSPTTSSGSSCSLHQAARLCRAARVSGTSTTVQPGAYSPSVRETTTAAAPFREASAAKQLPSKRSPHSATNTQPGAMARLSVVTPAVMARSPVATALPPVAAIRSLTVRCVMISGWVQCPGLREGMLIPSGFFSS